MDQDKTFPTLTERRDFLTTQGCICKMVILIIDEATIWIMAAQGAVMNHTIPKYVTRARASFDARRT
jgi:hypothetical protein